MPGANTSLFGLVISNEGKKFYDIDTRTVAAVRRAAAVTDEDAVVAVPIFVRLSSATAASGHGDDVSVVKSVVDAAPSSVVAANGTSPVSNVLKLFTAVIY